MIRYTKTVEPLVTSKPTIDLLLTQDRPGDLIALYTFYYYTAKWQETNAPKCTTSYVAEGLKWSEERVQKSKNILLSLGLIENCKTYGDDGRVTGHYIQLHLIWTYDEANAAKANVTSTTPISQGVVDSGINALVEKGNLNALESNPLTPSKPNQRVVRPRPTIKKPLLPFIEAFPKQYQNNPLFLKAWEYYLAERKDKKVPITERAADLISMKLEKACGTNVDWAIDCLNQSTECSYRGVFITKFETRAVQTYREPATKTKASVYNHDHYDGAKIIPDPDYLGELGLK